MSIIRIPNLNDENCLENLIKSQFIEMFRNSEKLPLCELANIIMGQSPLSEFYNENGNGFPFYQGKTEFGDVFINKPVTWCTKPTRLSHTGDILMCVRAPVGSTFKTINKQQVFNLLLPKAEKNEQDVFIEFANQINKSKFTMERNLYKLQELFGSLMQQFFL